MKWLLFTCILYASLANAQTYKDSILQHRVKYKQEFLLDAHSPLKAKDTGYIRFYTPDKHFRIIADFTLTPDAIPFKMETHSGIVKMYRQYGIVHFAIAGHDCSLEVYQSLALMKREDLKNYLFIPFNDATNYESTYAGGRYIDLSIQDIQDNKVVIDFNKCYNPYCAYAEGYSCPIPPPANKLKVKIEAGEKSFGKNIN